MWTAQPSSFDGSSALWDPKFLWRGGDQESCKRSCDETAARIQLLDNLVVEESLQPDRQFIVLWYRGGPHMRSLISIDFPAPEMEPESAHAVSAVSVP